MKGILLIVGFVGSTAIRGAVLCAMWGWFVVPLGVPQINFWHGLGLATFVTLFYRMDIATEEKSSAEIILASIIQGVATVAIGAFIRWAMGGF